MSSARADRVRSGIPEFDKMLNGGYMRGDSVLLAGSAGTGKSTMGLQYLIQGAKDGEAGSISHSKRCQTSSTGTRRTSVGM